ncbi:MAG: S41 family peptidase [Bacteroidales bacterium]|jgi:carboxyl-terminal processing protease|nr:S41 family peptidase [Bacteroidales bacterium]
MVKKFSLSFIVIVFCLLNTINSFSQIDDEKYFEMNKAIETFGSVFKSLHSNYVDELNSGDLVKTAIDAMLAKLDPYTNFYPESEMEEVKLQYLGQYGGIGALIHYKNGIVYISEPYEGLPAYKAGVKAGDAILSIDGESAKGKTSNQVSEKLRGQAGTEIELELERDGKIIKKTFRREDIQLPNVPYFGMIDSVVGYIKLNEFTKEAAKHVQEAFENLKRQNMQYLIFDLRGNGGGLLQEAVNIVNLFVDKGQVVVSTKAKTVEKNSVFKTTKKAIDTKIPIVVLIDGTSASASEIVSGSLQDFDRAVIMGQCSFGKGLVQNILPLIYNSQIKVTVSKYYIPSGRCIQAIDYSHRDKDGNANKIPDSLRTAFKTKGGRTVYDGLGIEPDITIEPEYASNIAIALISKFLCFDYATKFVKENPNIASAKDFEITDEIYNDFIEFLKDKDYNYTTTSEKILDDLITSAKKEKLGENTLKEIELIKTQIAEDKKEDLIKYKEDIKEILLSEIVVRYYNQKGRIEALLKHDNEVKEATKLLYDQKQYNKTLGK